MRTASWVAVVMVLTACPAWSVEQADAPGRQPPAPAPSAPAAAALAAARDVLTIQPASERPYYRYLSLHNYPTAAQRQRKGILFISHINDLSREPFESEADFVHDLPGGRTTFLVIRFDLRKFGMDPKTWEKLGTFDTFFHDVVRENDQVATEAEYEVEYVEAEVELERKSVDNGRTTWVRPKGSATADWKLEKGTYEGQTRDGLSEEDRKSLGLLVPVKKLKNTSTQVLKGDGKDVQAIASHLSYDENEAAKKAKLKLLGDAAVAMSRPGIPCRSPILLGTWFWAQTVTQHGQKYQGKAPGYYDFLGIKNQRDFEDAVGADLTRARTTYPEEIWATVDRSEVAVNNRRLIRLSRAWFTMDANENTGKRNYTEVLDIDFKAKGFDKELAQPDEFDATEAIGRLPNGHLAHFLGNNKGVRQNFAPPEIANAKNDPHVHTADTRVHNHLRCLTCHLDGLRVVDDVIRPRGGGDFELRSLTDFRAYERLKQLYKPDFNRQVRLDQKDYQEVIARSTGGWTTKEYAQEVGDTWNEYVEGDFGLVELERLTGRPRNRIRDALDRLSKPPGQGGIGFISPTLAGLIVKPVSLPIRSEKVEELFPLLMFYSQGAVPAAPVKIDDKGARKLPAGTPVVPPRTQKEEVRK